MVDHVREDLEPMAVTEFDGEEEAGSRKLSKATDPRLPSAEEVEQHNTSCLYLA